MVALLQQYSLSEILIFTIFLALAVKSLITFFDWCNERLQRILNKQQSKTDEKKELERRLQHGSEIMAALETNQQKNDLILQDLSAKIDLLMDSDKDSIKAYITGRHHYFCYKMGWIDDFSLDCLEKRYQHYSDEGGNSFIELFMEELRNLPKQKPGSEENIQNQ